MAGVIRKLALCAGIWCVADTLVTSVNDLLCATCEPATDEAAAPVGEVKDTPSGLLLSPHPPAASASAAKIWIVRIIGLSLLGALAGSTSTRMRFGRTPSFVGYC
jgi:hypothetical protein